MPARSPGAATAGAVSSVTRPSGWAGCGTVPQPAQPDGRVTDETAPAVAAPGDLAGITHVDPGLQNIGKTEPVRCPQWSYPTDSPHRDPGMAKMRDRRCRLPTAAALVGDGASLRWPLACRWG